MYLRSLYIYFPKPVEMRSEVKFCGRSITAVAGSKPAEIMNVRLLGSLCTVKVAACV